MYIELSVEYCVEATMECKLCWEVILLLVCVRSSLRVCAAEGKVIQIINIYFTEVTLVISV